MATADEYQQRAKAQLRDIMDTEHALLRAEAIARLAESYHHGDARNIDAHHVGPALDELVEAGVFITDRQQTRGEQPITTYQPADQSRRRTRIASAAARKRILGARYNGWAQGSVRYPHGVIGPAGEEAVRLAILESNAMQPAAPNAGPVSRNLNVALPGPADSGGYVNPIVNGLPQPPVTVLIEVKNVRGWMYPNSSEVFQVLHKCLALKLAHRQQPVVPILVCRAAHKTMFWMAKQLGFVVIDMGVQWVGRQVDEKSLLEVRNELSFNDLRHVNGPSLRVRDRLREKLPPHIQEFAEVWDETTSDPDMVETLSRLGGRLSGQERQFLVSDLRDHNRALDRQGGW